MSWVDDFEGERRDVTKLTTERLLDIRSQTVTELTDERRGTAMNSWWETQLEIIDEELDQRGVTP